MLESLDLDIVLLLFCLSLARLNLVAGPVVESAGFIQVMEVNHRSGIWILKISGRGANGNNIVAARWNILLGLNALVSWIAYLCLILWNKGSIRDALRLLLEGIEV